MDFPIKSGPSAIGHRADWLPDAGVQMYVRDILSEDFKVNLSVLPEHWIPLSIVGTLDWVTICGWWVFRNTGIFESDKPYEKIFDFDGYEFDPDQLMMFEENEQRHKFKERIASPGITGKERTEALQFLFQDVFEVWYKAEREYTQAESEGFFPPQEFIELTMYATFMWVLDTYGRDWIRKQDQVFACVFDHKVAYLSRWDGTLLDPDIMVCTQRPLNSCRYCGNVLWCVAGTTIDRGWINVCNHCLVERAANHGGIDEYDQRLKAPHCPHWEGLDGSKGNCASTCPHSGMTAEKVWEAWEDMGSQRLEEYRQRAVLNGGNDRQMAGQTMQSIVDHLNGPSKNPSQFQRRQREIKD